MGFGWPVVTGCLLPGRVLQGLTCGGSVITCSTVVVESSDELHGGRSYSRLRVSRFPAIVVLGYGVFFFLKVDGEYGL